MYLYLLVNKLTGRLYIGITKDIDRRLKEHNWLSNHFTSRQKGDWKLVKYKFIDNKIEARKEELRLKKSKNKKYILWYFSNN